MLWKHNNQNVSSFYPETVPLNKNSPFLLSSSSPGPWNHHSTFCLPGQVPHRSGVTQYLSYSLSIFKKALQAVLCVVRTVGVRMNSFLGKEGRRGMQVGMRVGKLQGQRKIMGELKSPPELHSGRVLFPCNISQRGRAVCQAHLLQQGMLNPTAWV